jgi:hypothetical protein
MTSEDRGLPTQGPFTMYLATPCKVVGARQEKMNILLQ